MMDIEQARIHAQIALERADKEIAAKWANSHLYPSHLSDIPLLANNLLNALEEIKRLHGVIERASGLPDGSYKYLPSETDELRKEVVSLSTQLAEANRER